jgi:tRNA (guanine-N7-)-methyltransferase
MRPAIDLRAHLIDPAPFDAPAPINWLELFGNDNPVELEIGSGKGLFLINAASSASGHNFLGVELARKYARMAAERLARRELTNAKIWRGDARLILGRLVPAASVRAVHVYFPDPWWKKRHKKRRVFTEELVAQVDRALEPGGRLRVASDVEEYFVLIQSLIAANPRFREEPVTEPNGPGHELDCLTNFERKYRLEGRPIFRAHYEWRWSNCHDGTAGAMAIMSPPTPS